MASAESFNEPQFRQNVDAAMASVRRILATTKSAEYVADVAHTYDDKFALVGVAVDSFVEAAGVLFGALGLDAAALKKLRSWARENKVQPPENPTCVLSL